MVVFDKKESTGAWLSKLYGFHFLSKRITKFLDLILSKIVTNKQIF